jgi:hypothetical protein
MIDSILDHNQSGDGVRLFSRESISSGMLEARTRKMGVTNIKLQT